MSRFITAFLVSLFSIFAVCEARDHADIFIVPGYAATPFDHWFPWLDVNFEEKDLEVSIIEMPSPNSPNLVEWVGTLRDVIGMPDDRTFFVAHSLGCITLLRYLESLPEGTKIGGIVLVSGFDASLPILPELDSFIQEPIEYSRIKRMTPQRVLITAMDDTIVPYKLTENLGKSLGGEVIVTDHGGHFLESDGFTSFPLVASTLERMIAQE